jgi:hypothetical protein
MVSHRRYRPAGHQIEAPASSPAVKWTFRYTLVSYQIFWQRLVLIRLQASRVLSGGHEETTARSESSGPLQVKPLRSSAGGR